MWCSPLEKLFFAKKPLLGFWNWNMAVLHFLLTLECKRQMRWWLDNHDWYHSILQWARKYQSDHWFWISIVLKKGKSLNTSLFCILEITSPSVAHVLDVTNTLGTFWDLNILQSSTTRVLSAVTIVGQVDYSDFTKKWNSNRKAWCEFFLLANQNNWKKIVL